MRTILALLLLATCVALGAEEALVARFPQPSAHTLRTYLNTNHDVAAYKPGEYLDIVMPVSEYEALRTAGYNVTVHTTEQQMRDHLAQSTGRPIAGYHEYDAMHEILQTYATAFPNICALYDIGDTWGTEYASQGYSYYDDFQHEIWALKVSANPTVEEDEPNIYFLGEHHAREPISTEVALAVLDHMMLNYGSNPEITDDIDNKAIWFVPMVNPNGGKIVLDQTDIWWRKNTRDNNGNHTFDSDYATGTGDDGVDLNRNYGYTWGNVGSTDDPNGTTYHGPNEFSEPESQAVRDLIDAHHFVAGISYHSYGEEVLYPYGYAEDIYAPDVGALSALADNIAENINAQGPGHYTSMASYALYPTTGGTDDWAYGKHGVFGYTVELAEEFIPDQSDIEDICDANIPGAMILLDRIDHATLTGHITDADTGQPLQAEVYVHNIDNTGEERDPIRGDTAFGRYWRMLPPGEWVVDFRCYGYESEPAWVTITEDGITTQDAALTPAETTTYSGLVYDGVNGWPLQGAVVILHGTPLDPVITGADGSFSFGDVAVGAYEMTVTLPGYGLYRDVRLVSPGANPQVALYPPFFTDDFEDGLSAWTTTGSWGLSTSQSQSPTHSLSDSPTGEYGNNQNTRVTFDLNIDLTMCTNASVSFYAKWAIESGYDYCHLQARPEGQSEWTTIASFTGESDWTMQYFALNQFAGSNVEMRFAFQSDTYVTDDGIYIDDFALYKDEPVDLNWGDVNDDDEITAADADAVLELTAGLDPLPELDPIPWEPLRLATANVDGLGEVTAYDASLIYRYVDGIIDSFPAATHVLEIPAVAITATVADGVITLNAMGELYGLSLTTTVEDIFVPGLLTVLANDVQTAESIGDVTNHFALASTQALSGDFLTLAYTLNGNLTDDVVIHMNVNNAPVDLVLDEDILPVTGNEVPAVTRLRANYPNPFNPTTTVAFDLAHPGPVQLHVYNVRGQLVTTLVNDTLPAGSHTVSWQGRNSSEQSVSSGLYFLRLQADGQTQVRKALLLK